MIRVKNSVTRLVDFPRLSAAQKKYLSSLLLSWVLFFSFMTLYCYSQMLATNEPVYTTVGQAFQCVLKDWIVWLVISPVLIHTSNKQKPTYANSKLGLILVLSTCVLIAAVYRIGVEYWVAGYSASDTFFLYFPRYFLASGLTLLISRLYSDKLSIQSKLKKYEDKQNVVTKAPEIGKNLLVYKGANKVIIAIKDIHFITASGNYLEIHTQNNHYLLRKTMKQMQAQLDPAQFARIHRSHLVNLSAVVSVCHAKLEAVLNNGQKLRLGKKYLSSIPHFNI